LFFLQQFALTTIKYIREIASKGIKTPESILIHLFDFT